MARANTNGHIHTKNTGKALARAALILSVFVIVLGAFTRLTDAGLGCPDWPGCYGQLLVPKSEHAIAQANAAFPDRPLEQAKAWAEMIHRYLAGTLALLVFFICALHWRAKSQYRAITTTLSTLIVGQAALGMWTVTLGLKPIIVAAHLMGGFATFCLILLLNVRQSRFLHAFDHLPNRPRFNGRNPLFMIAMIALVVQIFLGGWTAANYAATVCVELPICQGDWMSHLNFSEAFKLWWHNIGPYQGGQSPFEFATHITPDVKITIHVMHRFGAWIVTGLICLCILQLWRANRTLAAVLGTLLASQVLLGISNVLFHLPLAIAVAHNLMAALLLGWMLVIFKWSTLQTGYQTNDSRNAKNTSSQTFDPVNSTGV